jgi:hypothetical protein
MMSFFRQCFPTRITKDQAKDTGMAMVLLCLIIGFLAHIDRLFALAVVLLVITMVVPMVYRPVAVVWLGLSHIIGTVVSRVLLTLVFFVVVAPVGIVRRLLNKDSLHIREFGRGEGSVMKIRDHLYVPSDIDKPY